MTADLDKAVERLGWMVGDVATEDLRLVISELSRLREENATLTRERDEARGLWEWLASRRNLELSYGVIDDPSEAFWLVLGQRRDQRSRMDACRYRIYAA